MKLYKINTDRTNSKFDRTWNNIVVVLFRQSKGLTKEKLAAVCGSAEFVDQCIKDGSLCVYGETKPKAKKLIPPQEPVEVKAKPKKKAKKKAKKKTG